MLAEAPQKIGRRKYSKMLENFWCMEVMITGNHDVGLSNHYGYQNRKISDIADRRHLYRNLSHKDNRFGNFLSITLDASVMEWLHSPNPLQFLQYVLLGNFLFLGILTSCILKFAKRQQASFCNDDLTLFLDKSNPLPFAQMKSFADALRNGDLAFGANP